VPVLPAPGIAPASQKQLCPPTRRAWPEEIDGLLAMPRTGTLRRILNFWLKMGWPYRLICLSTAFRPNADSLCPLREQPSSDCN
jgi:hypothetical protein